MFRLPGLWFLALWLAVASTASLASLSVDWALPDAPWQTLESEHFRVYYRPAHRPQAERAARQAEQVHRRLSKTYSWTPSDKTDLVIVDNFDLSNGWASVWPSNHIRIYLSAPDDLNTLENYDDWLDLLITHEYTHIIHLDKASAAPRFLRRIFGRQAWLFPNSYQPLFMIEGLAIHEESDAHSHIGRSYSSLYAGMMQAQVDAGARSISEVSVASRRWPLADGYLYGAFFFLFLEQRYGAEAAAEFVERYSRNIIPFSMNRTARRYFGKDFRLLWQEFQHWLEEAFPASDKALPGEPLFAHGQYSAAPLATPNGVYHSWHDGHGIARLKHYRNDGSVDTITDMKYPGLIEVHANGEILMASTRLRQENRLWSDLYHYNGRSWRRLTRDGRYREARWLGEQIIARRFSDGIAGLDLLDRQGKPLRTLWEGEDGEVLGRISLSPAGDHLVAAYKPLGRSWQLARIELDSGELSLLTDNPWLQAQPSYASDGSLLFSADYDGRFNIYRLRPDTGELIQLSNVATAALNPVQAPAGEIYFEYLSEQGYRLHRLSRDAEGLAVSVPVHQEAAAAPRLSPEPTFDVAAMDDVRHYPYRPWRSLRPRWWLPILGVTEESSTVGVITGGADSLKQHQYELSLAYEDQTAELLGSILYLFSNRYQFYAQRNLSYYLDGTAAEDAEQRILRIRASDTLSLSRLNLWNGWDNQLRLLAGVFAEKEHDRYWHQDVLPRDAQERGLIGAALVFDNSQGFRHSISPAYGRTLVLIAESNQWLTKDYQGSLYSALWQEYLHLGRSQVLAVELAGSRGDDNSKPFRLHDGGGELRPSFLGRDDYRLRGYADHRIIGQDAAVASIEWRFPLARIQRNWHTYPLGLRDLHGALFVDSGRVWRPVGAAEEGRSYTGIGMQFTTELMFAYQGLLPLTLGVAKGLDDELGERRAYLRLGISF